MANGLMEGLALGESTGAGRVLVFTVDDGWFSLQLDWVEAVYQRDGVAVHVVKTRGGRSQAFLSHRREPALIVDLRDLFGLSSALGETDRSAFVVVRSGSYLLALQADACVGVRELDIRGQVPLESSLVRDGGLCVGHLIEQDGSILAVLDPNRLLDGSMRDALEPALREARGFIDRQQKVDELWGELCSAPTVGGVRMYSRLCKRIGRAKAANAARTVLKHMEAGDAAGAAGDTPGERLVRDLIRHAAERRTGELIFERDDGAVEGKIFLADGRVIDAHYQHEWGRRALRRLLDAREGRYRLTDAGAEDRPVRMTESTVASIIGSLELINEERRGRRER